MMTDLLEESLTGRREKMLRSVGFVETEEANHADNPVDDTTALISH